MHGNDVIYEQLILIFFLSLGTKEYLLSLLYCRIADSVHRVSSKSHEADEKTLYCCFYLALFNYQNKEILH